MSSLNEINQDLIDRFFLDQLSMEEKRLFEEKQKDREFAAEVDLHQSLLQAVEFNGDMDLKKSLVDEEKQLNIITPKPPKVIPKDRKTYQIALIAASILLLLGLLWWIVQAPTSNNYLATYFKPYPNVVVPIERNVGALTKEEQVFKDYELRNYKKALKGIDALLKEKKNFPLLYYKANTLIALRELEKATTLFEELLLLDAFQFQEQTKWYLALLYLNNQENKKAEKLLNELKNSGSFNQKLVQEILSSDFS